MGAGAHIAQGSNSVEGQRLAKASSVASKLQEQALSDLQNTAGNEFENGANVSGPSVLVQDPPGDWDHFKGRWRREKDGSEMGTIRTGVLRWAVEFGAVDSTLKLQGVGELRLLLDGIAHAGVLTGHRLLSWSDGEVWQLCEDPVWEAFEGTWLGPKEQERASICRGILRWSDNHKGVNPQEVELQLLDGESSQAKLSQGESTRSARPRILLRMWGARYTASLVERPIADGGGKELTWSDGEIWRLVERAGSVAPVGVLNDAAQSKQEPLQLKQCSHQEEPDADELDRF